MEVSVAIVTVSDTRSESSDVSGDTLAVSVKNAGYVVAERLLVTDDRISLEDALRSLTDRDDIDLILTTGGTGLSPRDNTPEATTTVIEREVPGIAEAMRRGTADKTPMSMLSRGVAGICGNTLIINLPGSPKGVIECFEVLRPVLRHALDQVKGRTSHDTK